MESPEADRGLVDYYRRRAAEYEAIYARPERQADLQVLKISVTERLADKTVLEIACGTGYWTQAIAQAAQRVLATDVAEEPMRIAQAKSYPAGKVAFETADAYALGEALGRFDAAFAGFWWSHVPRERITEFLRSLHARLEPGARVLLLDNTYVEGNSTALAGIDAAGNTYQMRRLGDGTQVRVLKNFVSEAELQDRLSAHAGAFRFEALKYYWLAEYRGDERLPGVKLVLASGNPGKLREIRAILAPRAIEVVAQSELGIGEAAEPYETFVDNALAKARHASRAAGLAALADDSGLCVDALGGAPGVHSAYYAGKEGSRETRDARNNEKLLRELKDNRKARYSCVIVLVRNPDDAKPLVAEGLWRGEIARAPRGANGFGYDPLFYVPELGKTAAELDAATKNRVSHRGQALARLLKLLDGAGLS